MDKTYGVVSGYLRLKVAKELGVKRIDPLTVLIHPKRKKKRGRKSI